MPILTGFKTETLLKTGAILSNVHIGVSTIDGEAAIEVDTDKIGVHIAVEFKIEVEEAKTDDVLTG